MIVGFTDIPKCSMCDESRTYILGKQYEARKKRHGGDRKSSDQNDLLNLPEDVRVQWMRQGERGKQRDQNDPFILKTAEKIGKEQHVSSPTVKRAAIRKVSPIIQCAVCHARFATNHDLSIHKKYCEKVGP